MHVPPIAALCRPPPPREGPRTATAAPDSTSAARAVAARSTASGGGGSSPARQDRGVGPEGPSEVSTERTAENLPPGFSTACTPGSQAAGSRSSPPPYSRLTPSATSALYPGNPLRHRPPLLGATRTGADLSYRPAAERSSAGVAAELMGNRIDRRRFHGSSPPVITLGTGCADRATVARYRPPDPTLEPEWRPRLRHTRSVPAHEPAPLRCVAWGAGNRFCPRHSFRSPSQPPRCDAHPRLPPAAPVCHIHIRQSVIHPDGTHLGRAREPRPLILDPGAI